MKLDKLNYALIQPNDDNTRFLQVWFSDKLDFVCGDYVNEIVLNGESLKFVVGSTTYDSGNSKITGTWNKIQVTDDNVVDNPA